MGNILKVQDIVENQISLHDARSMAIMYKGEVFSYFDEGCTRFVFVNKDKSKVIKLLKSNLGKDYNKEEAEIYEKASPEDKLQMAESIMHDGFIEQKFCLPIKYGGKKLTIPERLFAASCRNEVGWTEEGTLVCFDLDEFKKY